MYKVDGPSNLAFRFRSAGNNDELMAEAWENSKVFLDVIEIDGRLNLMIQVDENTRAEQLRKVIPYALKLRDKLMDFQGAWSFGGDNEFFERLSHLQETGMTYNQIAEMLKSKLEKHLRAAVGFEEELRKALPNLKTQGDYFFWAFGENGISKRYNPNSLDTAKTILGLIGMEEKEIDEWLQDGKENIKAGKMPFPQNPITRTDIIQILRTWRKGKKHRSIRAREERDREEELNN